MTEPSSVLLPFLSKLERHTRVGAADREAILGLPHSLRRLDPGSTLFREGDRASHCCVVLSGMVCRHKLLSNGARQILSVHIKGDGVDLQNALLGRVDYNMQALTRSEVALIPATAVNALISSSPLAARAMWIETLLDASIQREWTLNVGRRDGRSRVAHLLCELGVRLEAADLGERQRYDLPLTQEQLGDVTGLTAVHVNRVLQELRAAGLISREKSPLRIDDWEELAEAGGFHSTYLHPMKTAL